MMTAGPVTHQSGSFLISSFRPLILDCKFKAQPKILKIPGTPFQHSAVVRRVRCSSAGRGYNPRFVSGGNFEQEPFWLSLVKDIVGSLRSLAVFLVEQPSQLKYIEWPTFQSTLKTATLTLILVAVLIVALSSIDSLLSFILTLLLRKAA